jgi:hypothetical protein
MAFRDPLAPDVTSEGAPMTRSMRWQALVTLGWLGSALSVTACDSGPSIAESLDAKAQEEKFDYQPNPKPRPKGLDGPTEAELKAWDRKDATGEKHLYKWDKANLDRMMLYWEEIACFREKVKEEGERAFGAEPGSPQEEAWFQFKRTYVAHVNGWQQRLFAKEPRVQEKSKFIGDFLAAHELVMTGYPRGYNEGDRDALEENDLLYERLVFKIKKYVESLGETYPELDPTDDKAMAKHAEVCAEALTPPDRTGKVERRKGKKGKI